MSLPVARIVKGTVTVAAAALFIQIGSAAAASPRGDFQQQIGRVLAGTPARPSIAHPGVSLPGNPARDTDVQAFVRGLLLGVSVSHPRAADSGKRRKPEGALEVARGPSPGDDEQASVRQLLLGQHAPMHRAL